VVGVVDHGGFTAAARALHVAQPSLSQGIRRLEHELGVALFERTGRSVRTTQAGDAFLPAARSLLQAAADAHAVIGRFRRGDTGVLELVALPTLVVDPVAGLVGQLRRTHPGLGVRMAEPESPADLVHRVRDGRSEIGITTLTGDLHGLRRLRLGRQELVAVCPPGTPIPADGPLMLEDLAGSAMIASPVGTSSRALMEAAFAETGVPAQITIETSQRDAIIPLVLAGAGIAFLPAALAEQAAVRGAVVARTQPVLSRMIGIVHRPGPLSPAGVVFLQLARRHARAAATPVATAAASPDQPVSTRTARPVSRAGTPTRQPTRR
jgi:LysR family carnitine catabolism transcriptional activator